MFQGQCTDFADCKQVNVVLFVFLEGLVALLAILALQHYFVAESFKARFVFCILSSRHFQDVCHYAQDFYLFDVLDDGVLRGDRFTRFSLDAALLISPDKGFEELVGLIDHGVVRLFALAVGYLKHEPLGADGQVTQLSVHLLVLVNCYGDVMLRLHEAILLLHDGSDLNGRVSDN